MANPRPNFGSQMATSSNLVPTSDRESMIAAVADSASWAITGDAYSPVPVTTPSIPAGFYACESGNGAIWFRRMPITTDDLVRLPCETTDMLLREFVMFWERVERFAERGLSAKRGLMLWGPPGSGKTSSVHLMAAHMVEKLNGVVVMAGYPTITAALLAALRRIEPARPVIVVYEDIDAMVQRYGESDLLAMLDGELQIANVVNVATTNYPERLDRRFADRPGRFDRMQYVGMPTAEARRAYFTLRAADAPPERIERWVAASEGWSIAHLRELIVATLVLEDEDDDTIERLNDMRELPDSDHAPDRAKSIGFAA